jgi:transposase
MKVGVGDDGGRRPDELWARMESRLPPRPKHPLGGHHPRVPDRAAMDAIFFVPRTGCQRNALSATGICSSGAPAVHGGDRGRAVRGVLAPGSLGA